MKSQDNFEGFPKDSIQFLSELARNNEREWFAEQKERYEQVIVDPMQRFVVAIGDRLQQISPDIHVDPAVNGRGSMMRIYRDTRFSKDKTPYRTRIAAIFWEGPKKKMLNPGFGIQWGADGWGLMAGLFHFDKEDLEKFRRAVDDPASEQELETIVGRIPERGPYSIEGESYKRVPREYASDHPRADLLRLKGIHTSFFDPSVDALYRPDFVDVCSQHFHQMAPVQRWLVENL